MQSPEAKKGCSPQAVRHAEAYGDCLTYGPGHYETWAQWRRRDKTVDAALRALVRSYEYEDWPRGRIVFDRSRDLFILYADRKLLTPATIARINTRFHLPADRTDSLSERRDAERASHKIHGALNTVASRPEATMHGSGKAKLPSLQRSAAR